MKKLVFIALISLFYSSCKKAIQKEEILEIKENSFTCKIEAANLKVNVNNNEQCANYFNYTQDSENGFKLEAGQLKDVVGILLNINLINFQVNSNKTKGKFFYVDYKGELNDEHKTMVVNRLLEHYNLKIDTVQKKVAINSLKITNKDKLGSFLSKVDRQKQLRTSLKVSGNEAVFENFTLSGFAK
ncbi:hypothetical protein SAMN04488096_105195 [Mesonia phycicola]|uniref:Uncharacterized protein n=1 Tax=Mesonia phycicola TaxID=579105 RepID=A0A1M6EPH6_9FLAO|nr:hypothetical protein [Mesonia phycicola]SHI87415.1 hypothetical protein SAMN04488096_105195 [Mesonia phycicola]